MKIVVLGGTGLIGSKLIEKLRAHGHNPLAASLEVTDERALIPGDNLRIGATRFADWLSRSTTKPTTTPQPYQPQGASA